MRLLLTRPIDDAKETAACLAQRGHEVLVAPLLEIRFCEDAPIVFDGVQAILATSSNGVRALVRRSERRDLPVFAVGTQTGRCARELGFAQVRVAGGDAEALARAIPAWTKTEGGALLHAAGTDKPGRLAESLGANGYAVRTARLYCADAVTELPAIAREALQAKSLDAVLFFSPRTATTFARLVEQERVAECCRVLAAYCISEAAAVPLKALGFRIVRAAARPDQESLLALLG